MEVEGLTVTTFVVMMSFAILAGISHPSPSLVHPSHSRRQLIFATKFSGCQDPLPANR
jgi:hypothetical protein